MDPEFDADREERRRRFRRNLPWLIPTVLVVGTGLFIGIGHLVAWLWRVTLVDIFAIKPISFWQAWGILLLAQLLFKANMQSTARTGHRGHRRAPAGGRDPEPVPGEPGGA